MTRTTEELLIEADAMVRLFNTLIFKGDKVIEEISPLIAELSAKLREVNDTINSKERG